tara:strand:- start:13710 stop:15251 length:1542 start_codon:yes stop_codon:yes gene_type:complete
VVADPLGSHTVDSFPDKKKLAKTPEQIAEEIREISEFPYPVDLPDRRLRGKMMADYGVKMGYDRETGSTPEIVYFPYTWNGELVRYKARLLTEKKMWGVSASKDVDLFGWDKAVASGAKRLIITEGEFDAIALTRIIDLHTKDQFKELKPAVCSLPNGASSAKRDLSKLSRKIRAQFKEILFCFDQDEAGEKALKDSMSVFPAAKSISLPAKDANACIIEGKTRAAFKATTFNAEKVKNTRLVWGESLHVAGREPAQWGYSWPWAHLNDVTRGIRLGETIYIGAGVKMGKSEVVNALGAHCIKEHGWKVFMAKPEEANRKTYQLMAGKLVGKVFHDPKVEFDYDAYDRAGEILDGKLAMLDLYQNIEWETLKEDIRTAAHEGCKAVFIDPITNLTNGMNAADANVKLQAIAQELSAMAKDLEIVVFIFCHLKAPDNGAPHERGGKVYSSQFAGSRAMMRSCNLMIGIEGNKDPDLPVEERNIRVLDLLEDREFGQSGRFPLYWNPVTSLFSEA